MMEEERWGLFMTLNGRLVKKSLIQGHMEGSKMSLIMIQIMIMILIPVLYSHSFVF